MNRDNLNFSNDMMIEFLDLRCRDPVFLMVGIADGVYFIVAQEFLQHIEAQYISSEV